ncbi:alkane hydroxylase MAH1-like [Carex rostrata]
MSQKSFCTFIAKTTRDKIENALLPFLSQTVEHDQVIDLQDIFSRLSFDMSCILSFGTDPGSLSMDLPVVPFARAVDDTSAALFSRLSSPAALWKLLKLLGIGQEKNLAKARVVGDRFIIEAIEKRKQEMNEGKHICPDMLSSYLSDEDVPNSNEFLRDNLDSFLTAGRDTTSSGLCWFFWALSQNKQTEEKILSELRSARHTITPKGLITFDPEELDNLVYFKAAFMESLRLFPPIPHNWKAVLKHDLLPCGFRVTPEMNIIVSIYAMGTMQKIWGEDCLEYKPERWISEKGTLRHEPSYKFMAFNTGPRTCLGKNMALTQMKMIAATMVYNFCFEVVEGHVVEPALSITLKMKNGLRVRIRKRTSI